MTRFLDSRQRPHRRAVESACRVSVAILCHNYGRFLDDCIDSVSRQTVTLHEVFVVDDASEDDTAAICRRRGMTCLSVTHRDVHQVRRTSFEHATGDVIVFLDADDMLTPDYVRRGCDLFTDPRVAVVYSDVEYFGDRDGRSSYPDFDRDLLFRDNFIHAGSLVRRDALRLAGAFETMAHRAPTHMDWTIWKRLVRAGWTAAKQPELYRYRQHGANMLRKSVVSEYFDRADLATEPITLFVPLSGRLDLWQRFSRQLTALAWPKHLISLVLLDTSQQPGFSARVAGWVHGCDFPDVRHVRLAVGPPGLSDLDRRDSPDNVAAVRLAMAKIYNWARHHVVTNYVMFLEDDIFAPADVIERLLRGFDERTDSVTAAYQSRYYPAFVAWTVSGGLPVPVAKRGTGLEPIAGSGFGCLLMRREFLCSQMFSDTPHTPSGGVSHDFDVAFWMLAARQGRVCKIDWTIPVEHVGSQPRP